MTLAFPYEELPNVIQLTVGLNVDVEAAVKETDRVAKLGIVRIQKILIDGDGTSSVTLNSMAEFIEFNTLGFMSNSNEDFTIYYKWNLEED